MVIPAPAAAPTTGWPIACEPTTAPEGSPFCDCACSCTWAERTIRAAPDGNLQQAATDCRSDELARPPVQVCTSAVEDPPGVAPPAPPKPGARGRPSKLVTPSIGRYPLQICSRRGPRTCTT